MLPTLIRAFGGIFTGVSLYLAVFEAENFGERLLACAAAVLLFYVSWALADWWEMNSPPKKGRRQ